MLKQSALFEPGSLVMTSLSPDQTFLFSVLRTPNAPFAASWIGVCAASSMMV